MSADYLRAVVRIHRIRMFQRYRLARHSGFSPGGARDLVNAYAERHQLPTYRRNSRQWEVEQRA